MKILGEHSILYGQPRLPWGNFGPVIRNGDLKGLSNEPEYLAAKSGDENAAIILISRLIKDETLEAIRKRIGDTKPILCPVVSLEETGHNKIPLAAAALLGKRLNLAVEDKIRQTNTPHRTNKGSDHRLAFLPEFDGPVTPGASYLMVDDTLAMGGTLAALHSFIKSRGATPLAGIVMTAHEGALDLPVKEGMLRAIRQKHGDKMDALWQEEFGFGIDRLTQGEAGHLKAADSAQSMKDRLHAARKIGGMSNG